MHAKDEEFFESVSQSCSKCSNVHLDIGQLLESCQSAIQEYFQTVDRFLCHYVDDLLRFAIVYHAVKIQSLHRLDFLTNRYLKSYIIQIN